MTVPSSPTVPSPTSPTALTAREHWAGVAQGMQRDLAVCEQLKEALQQQFHAALRHAVEEMRTLAEQISAKVAALESSRKERVAHVRALLPAGAPLSMEAAFALLPPALGAQLQQLWQRLEAGVQTCKTLNQRNGQVIMEQAEIMRAVIAGPAQPEIYEPL